MLTPWKKIYDKPRQHIKKKTLLCKLLYSQSYGFWRAPTDLAGPHVMVAGLRTGNQAVDEEGAVVQGPV